MVLTKLLFTILIVQNCFAHYPGGVLLALRRCLKGTRNALAYDEVVQTAAYGEARADSFVGGFILQRFNERQSFLGFGQCELDNDFAQFCVTLGVVATRV
nr:hypothetical protein Itr_chr14CG28720 [Ipomoea trifida]